MPEPPPSAANNGEAAGAVVLIVGADEPFSRAVARLMTEGTRTVVHARGVTEAAQRMREHQVVFLVLWMVLPDGDTRDFFTRLREDPLTAAIPVLFVGEQLTDSLRHHSCRTEADGDLEGSPTAEAVADWIRNRLRRIREVPRDARRDPLTGLPSRAAFGEEYARLATGCRQEEEPLAVALITPDPQRAGDRISDDTLMRLASTLSNGLRATDVVARWGQEEFVVLLPGEHAPGGLRAMEKVLESWRKQGAEAVSISAGLTIVDPGVPAEQAILEAGRHLHAARIAGGNRVGSSAAPTPRRRGRVLLVICDRVMAKVFLNLLTREDLRAVVAADAEEAVHACSGRQRFQLMVIDTALPQADGFAVLAALKDLPRNRDVPVVMLLAANTEELVARALKMGVNDFAVRPFDPLMFVSRMRTLLADTTSGASARPRTCRVMVVDESPSALVVAGTSLHRYGGVEVFLCLGAQAARQRLAETPVDLVVAPLPMLEQGPNRLPDAPRAPAQKEAPGFVATVTDAPPSLAVLDKLGCLGALKQPLNPLTFGQELFALAGLELRNKASVPSSHLEAEIRRVIQSSRPA